MNMRLRRNIRSCRSAAMRTVKVLLVVCLMAAGFITPPALSAAAGTEFGAQPSRTVAMSHAHHGAQAAVDDHAVHRPDAERPLAAADEDCGPVACCPGDISAGFDAPGQPQVPSVRVFGVDRPPLPAPDPADDRPPRIS
jgi:hypothetical protein